MNKIEQIFVTTHLLLMEESFLCSPLFLGLIFTQWLIIFGTKKYPRGGINYWRIIYVDRVWQLLTCKAQNQFSRGTSIDVCDDLPFAWVRDEP